ncbi:putative microtubule-associated protein 70-2 [Abeliophyllum distichum]|uniref:Microtubule-associated protein 70-2 n=1 Tax=Abeliophyllum distichum TaxID=126358 RepID=A0ABD1RAA2_9LAMI
MVVELILIAPIEFNSILLIISNSNNNDGDGGSCTEAVQQNAAVGIPRSQAKNLSSSFDDGGSGSTVGDNLVTDAVEKDNQEISVSKETQNNGKITSQENGHESTASEKLKMENEDYVFGTLFDMLQKEVITLE